MREKLDKLYQELFYSIIKRAISISIIFAMLIPHFVMPVTYAMEMVNAAAGTEVITDETNPGKEDTSGENQFLEFYKLGQTKKVDSSILKATGKISYKSSNSDSVKVNSKGQVTWVSGTDPVIITAYEEENPENKIQYFASFERKYR